MYVSIVDFFGSSKFRNSYLLVAESIASYSQEKYIMPLCRTNLLCIISYQLPYKQYSTRRAAMRRINCYRRICSATTMNATIREPSRLKSLHTTCRFRMSKLNENHFVHSTTRYKTKISIDSQSFVYRSNREQRTFIQYQNLPMDKSAHCTMSSSVNHTIICTKL